MKTPEQWLVTLRDLTRSVPYQSERSQKSYEILLLESDIKAIQDEAFKAGMNHAAEIAGKLFSGSNAKLAIVTAMDKLP